MRLSVYSRSMGIWRHIRWGYALVVFRRDMLGLYMWGRGEVCVCWRDEVLCCYRGVGDVHFLGGEICAVVMCYEFADG